MKRNFTSLYFYTYMYFLRNKGEEMYGDFTLDFAQLWIAQLPAGSVHLSFEWWLKKLPARRCETAIVTEMGTLKPSCNKTQHGIC